MVTTMQISQPITILFWVLKTRIKNGKAPLMARITISSQRTEISVQRNVPVLGWDSKSQAVMSRTPEA
jgi:hypothetical protein